VRALREAAWSDIPVLAALDAELFGAQAWSPQTWWGEFAARPRRAYVVLDEAAEGGVVGYAGLDLAGDVADVMTIAVAPAAQGRGSGRVLLDRLVAEARAGGAEALLLEVRADNAPALALYERAGFTRVRVRTRYYQPEDVDAIIMRKDLT